MGVFVGGVSREDCPMTAESESSWLLLLLPLVGKGHSQRGAFVLRQKMSRRKQESEETLSEIL